MSHKTVIKAAAMLFASFAVLHADVIVGLPALSRTGNCSPFGCPAMLGEETYQQVYSSAVFSGSIDITDLEFFNTEHAGGSLSTANFSLSLSYTSKIPGFLNSGNPLNNIGSGSQTFFSGSLPGLSNGILDISGTPFLYDPSQGDLLLTVSITGAVPNSDPLFLDQSQNDAQTSRALFGASGAIAAFNTGLVTGFASNLPEPSAVWFIGAGILFVGRRYRSGLRR